jgi:hypothetical protein
MRPGSHGFAGGDAHADSKLRWIASHAGDLGQLGAKLDDCFLLCKRRQAGMMIVLALITLAAALAARATKGGSLI